MAEKMQVISYSDRTGKWFVQYGDTRNRYDTFTEAFVALAFVSEEAVIDLAAQSRYMSQVFKMKGK
jgi:hypothetical protein